MPEDSDYGFDYGALIPLHATYDPQNWAGEVPQEITPQGHQLPVTTSATLYEAYVPTDARFFESSNGKILARDAIVQIERGPTRFFLIELLRPVSGTSEAALVEFIRADIDSLQWLDTAPFELTQKYAPQRQYTYPAYLRSVGNFPSCTGDTP